MGSATIPYYARAETLPSALPTFADIEAATEIFSDQPARMVVGVGAHFVVKYGGGVDVLEGETMRFLQESANVPIPQVYAIFEHEKKSYIIMERVNGESLDSVWSRMDQNSKEVVAMKLRDILTQMRKLQSPGQYCSVGNGGLPDGIFWTNDPKNPFAGPFSTESDLNSAMVAKHVDCGMPKPKSDFYRLAFEYVFKGHGPVFTHGDLQRKNIIIRKGKHDLEVVLIDWEYAGWYPSYWEYSRAMFACGRWTDDWSFWIGRFLEPALNEFAWMDMILRELWS